MRPLFPFYGSQLQQPQPARYFLRCSRCGRAMPAHASVTEVLQVVYALCAACAPP
jgi:hypothetical protein